MVTGVSTGIFNILGKNAAARQKLAAIEAERILIGARADAEIKTATALADIKYKADDLAAAVEETKGLLEHDKAMPDAPGWINALRSSVRPVVTYLFLAMFILAKVILVTAAIPRVEAIADLVIVAGAILDDPTVGIFSAIMGFWFGQRSVEKMTQWASR
jgi:hypothetical protein